VETSDVSTDVTDASPGTSLRGSAQPLSREYDTAILDLDGVVYIGGEPVADSPRHVARARAAGLTVAFVTNNASRPPAEVAARLRRIGVECDDTDVVTSAQAAARLVAARVPAGSRVLVVGGGGLVEALAEHGLVAVSRLDEDPAAVVQGFHPDVGWRLLAEGAAAVNAGLPWIASNTDLTVPTAHGRSPGNGALVEVIARTTGVRPQVAGKPETPLLEETVRRVGGRRPLVVGDRLDTDVEGAVRCGMDSLLVMTGVTDVPTLAAAPPGLRPSFVAADLGGLFVAHPAPRVGTDEAVCGGWTARIEPDEERARPSLTGEGDPLDALRALASLCWAHADRGGPAWGADDVTAAWRAAQPSAQPLR
jgi:HAD superfamily hydrolase (TIGR01450 family)